MKIRVILVLFLVILVSSCSKTTVEYLGCGWNPPKEKQEGTNAYFMVDDVDGLMTLSFLNKDYETPSSKYYEYINFFEENDLNVTVFESTENAPKKGIKLYVVSREGYEGYVTSFNSHYRNFLGQCS